MKHHPATTHYQKIVYWSDEDQCFIGQCPGLFVGGVHGQDEAAVYQDLCQTVDDVLTSLEQDGEALPAPTNRTFSGVFNVRINPDLHRALVTRALASGDSLNRYIEQVLSGAINSPTVTKRPSPRINAARKTPATAKRTTRQRKHTATPI